MTLPLVRVLIGTTIGPVMVQNMQMLKGGAPSNILINRSTLEAGIKSDYRSFVNHLVNTPRHPHRKDAVYTVDVDRPIDAGGSWHLGMFVAHALLDANRLSVTSDARSDPPECVVWATGTLKRDLTVEHVGFVADKLTLSLDDFSAYTAAGIRVVAAIPADDSADISLTMRERLTALKVELLEVSDVDAVFCAVGLPEQRVYADPGKGEPIGDPFPGLRAFDFGDRAKFFGRGVARDKLLEHLHKQDAQDCAFAVVLGASGSGKSSIVQAGLIGDLQERSPHDAWRWVVMSPGRRNGDPVAALADGLWKSLPEVQDMKWTEDGLATWLRDHPDEASIPVRAGLERVLDKARAKEGGAARRARLLLVVDQLEELFTLVADADRVPFVQALDCLSHSGCVWVVANLRTDFFHRLAEVPGLEALTTLERCWRVPAMKRSELREAIEAPAQLAGARYAGADPDGRPLVEVLLREVEERPDTLPLLQFTLLKLFQRAVKEGDGSPPELTWEMYDNIGGVAGAVGRQAEETVQAQGPEAAHEVSEVVRRLGRLDAETKKPVSRPADLNALAPASKPTRRALVEALVRARLLVTDADLTDGCIRVRVTHEAVFTHWQKARDTLQRTAADQALEERVEQAAKLWSNRKRAPDLLLPSGLSLSEAEDLVRRRAEELDPLLVTFFNTSAKAAQTARDKEQRRTRSTVVALGTLAATALAFGAWGVGSANRVTEINADLVKANIEIVDTNNDLKQQKKAAEDRAEDARREGARAEAYDRIAREKAEESARQREAAISSLLSSSGLLASDVSASGPRDALALVLRATQAKNDSSVILEAPKNTEQAIVAALANGLRRLQAGDSRDQAPGTVMAVGHGLALITDGSRARVFQFGQDAPRNDFVGTAHVTAAAVDGRTIATGHEDGLVQLRSIESGVLVGSSHVSESAITSVALLSDSIAVVDKSGQLSFAERRYPKMVTQAMGGVTAIVAVEPGGSGVLVHVAGKGVYVIAPSRVSESYRIASLLGKPTQEELAAISPDGQLLAIRTVANDSSSSTIEIVDPLNDLPVAEVRADAKDMMFDDASRTLHILLQDGKVAVYKIDGNAGIDEKAAVWGRVPVRGPQRLVRSGRGDAGILVVGTDGNSETIRADFSGTRWFPLAVQVCRAIGERTGVNVKSAAIASREYCASLAEAARNQPELTSRTASKPLLAALRDISATDQMLQSSRGIEPYVSPAPDDASPDAQTGYAQEYGIGRPKDLAGALASYLQAAAAGDNFARYRLAFIDIERSAADRRESLEAAAAENYALAMNGLGILYSEGTELPRDDLKAREMFAKAINLGESIRAPLNLADMCLEGRGGPRDASAAGRLYRMAVTGRSPIAAYSLARAIAQRRIAPQGPDERRTLLAFASRFLADAAVQYAELLNDNKDGTFRNDPEARDALMAAAKAGNANAMLELAKLLLHEENHRAYGIAAELMLRSAKAGNSKQAGIALAQLLRDHGAEPAEVRHWYRVAQDLYAASMVDAFQNLSSQFQEPR